MGIADFALEMPSGKKSVTEVSRESGYGVEKLGQILPSGKFSVLAEGETSWGLGRDAAARVLARNPVALDEIGLVLYAGSSEWGTPFWSPAARIALELGIEQAHCYEVSNFCNAGMVAVKLADDQVRAGTHKHALVIIADRLSQLVEYGTGYIELFNFADGAAAVLVSADARYEVLGGAHHTDPQWVDSYYGEIKGGEIKVERGEKLDGLATAFIDNFTTLTHKVLAQVGAEVADVAYFLVTHGNQDTHRTYLAELGVDPSRSVFQYELDGHLGGADPFLALEQLEREGRIASGDLVIVATAGSGFTWGVTAIRRT
ncbi:3-oxoacyl-ACP synthase III family protein [Streptantibioticus ferralitis]|uniref:3-oxoacyl-[acyl-carrier-protein] synthase III C-terminal domain-containing protein n=1 Tax=Streptantibioticus ferralitis TaxID=236510 RepID=A0ABT5YU20_9ACTN|nr:3-oxoacyl-[acyl-carrier-protein] synthase III C-terminal domain-containing protein [Streptantibioticus ferralitis]MDF2254295.1 3-oxoacyl-[acyl-carrier-protein] synthase III C-terminal domain-containing protein [Streptantibioticus ferralitis]